MIAILNWILSTSPPSWKPWSGSRHAIIRGESRSATVFIPHRGFGPRRPPTPRGVPGLSPTDDLLCELDCPDVTGTGALLAELVGLGTGGVVAPINGCACRQEWEIPISRLSCIGEGA